MELKAKGEEEHRVEDCEDTELIEGRMKNGGSNERRGSEGSDKRKGNEGSEECVGITGAQEEMEGKMDSDMEIERERSEGKRERNDSSNGYGSGSDDTLMDNVERQESQKDNLKNNENGKATLVNNSEELGTARTPSTEKQCNGDYSKHLVEAVEHVISDPITQSPPPDQCQTGDGEETQPHLQITSSDAIVNMKGDTSYQHLNGHGEELEEDAPLNGAQEEEGKKKGAKLKGNSLRDLNSSQRRLLLALCILYFALYTLLSLIGPFFPIEANKKGLSPFETGIIISMSWLVMFFMAPLVGYLGTKIKLHYLTTGGVASAGLVSVLFGLLAYVPDRETFLALALVLRLIEGVSSATFCVTAWSVLIAAMGDSIQMSMAVLMAVQGVAVIVSPLLGGALYAAGGFIAPFVSLGVVVILVTPLSWWVMRNVPACEKANLGSIKTFIADIGVFLTAIYVTSFTLTFKFLESYVALYIKTEFDYGPQMAGVILSLACLSFVITAIIWAQIIRLIGCVPVMVVGSLLGLIVMSFVSPSHFFIFSAHPWQVFSMTCLFGVAFGASQTPAVPRLLELARKRRMPENYLTYGLVSACYNSAFDLGCFIGPLAGGTMYSYLGFGWSAFSLGCVLTVAGALVLLHFLIAKHLKKKGERSNLLSQQEEPEKVALNHDTDLQPDDTTSEPTRKDIEVQRPRSLVELSAATVLPPP